MRPAMRWRVALALIVGPAFAAAQGAPGEITFLAAGNINWSRGVKHPDSYNWQSSPVQVSIDVNGAVAQRSMTTFPLLNRPAARAEIAAMLGRDTSALDAPTVHYRTAHEFPLTFPSAEADARHPFQRLRSLVTGADVAFASLAMPLSASARRTGDYLGHPAFAEALRWAGFDVVSTASYQALDGETRGLLHTLDALKRAGVGHAGTGANLGEGRKPHVVRVNGRSVAFLAYSVAPAAGFADHELPGVVALDPLIVKEDIRRIRSQVDYVAVSFEWPVVEASPDTHPDARTFARSIIDAGADLILGHHPHVPPAAAGRGANGVPIMHLPRGVELYNGRAIFYSLGNLVYGHNHEYWGDNFVARVTLGPQRLTRIEILPMAGRGDELAQPYQLTGDRARAVLAQIQEATRRLGTTMEIVGDVGVIRP